MENFYPQGAHDKLSKKCYFIIFSSLTVAQTQRNIKFLNINFLSNFMCLLYNENINLRAQDPFLWILQPFFWKFGFQKYTDYCRFSWDLCFFIQLAVKIFIQVRPGFSVWLSVSKLTFELFVGWKLNSLDT